jgi:hypothetical protein
MNLRPIVDQELDRIRAAVSGAQTRSDIAYVVDQVRKNLHRRLDETINPEYSPEMPMIRISTDTRWP